MKVRKWRCRHGWTWRTGTKSVGASVVETRAGTFYASAWSGKTSSRILKRASLAAAKLACERWLDAHAAREAPSQRKGRT